MSGSGGTSTEAGVAVVESTVVLEASTMLLEAPTVAPEAPTVVPKAPMKAESLSFLVSEVLTPISMASHSDRVAVR